MRRSTVNATISSRLKERFDNGPILAGVYPRGETYETVSAPGGGLFEFRDAIDSHFDSFGLFPSSSFNGIFDLS